MAEPLSEEELQRLLDTSAGVWGGYVARMVAEIRRLRVAVAAEREACALALDELASRQDGFCDNCEADSHHIEVRVCRAAAAGMRMGAEAIRARE